MVIDAETFKLLVTALLPIAIAILVAFLTVWHTRQGKWWEKRFDAYSRIIRAIEDIYIACFQLSLRPPSQIDEEIRAAMPTRIRELAIVIRSAEYWLPEHSAQLLGELISAFGEPRDSSRDAFMAHWLKVATQIDKLRPKLREMFHRDLKIRV